MLTIIAAAIVVDRNHGMSHLPHLCRRHLPHLTFNLSSDYDPGRPPMPPPPPGESAAGVSGSPEGGAPSSSSFSSPPIRVMLDRRVTDVTEVDDKERTVTVQLVTYKMWKEPRIVVSHGLTCSDFSSLPPPSRQKKILFQTDRITFLSEEFFRKCVWSPTFVHLNLHASENFNLAKNPNIYGVDEESHIMLVSYNMITVGCTMHFTMYPFDTQASIHQKNYMGVLTVIIYDVLINGCLHIISHATLNTVLFFLIPCYVLMHYHGIIRLRLPRCYLPMYRPKNSC